jgi:hypothetical protein
MANVEVAVEDEATVIVDTGALGLASEETGETVPSLKDMKDAANSGKQKTEPKAKSAADEAAEALTAAQKTAEDNRRRAEAAEATMATERARADEATRIAAQNAQDATAAREEAKGGHLAIINSDIESATREIAAAEQELIRANEAGEFVKAAAAQKQLAKASAKLDRREADKVAFESGQTKAPTHEGRVEPQRQMSAFEQYVSNPNLTPSAQAWLRAHPDCVPANVGGDAEKNRKMMKGHYKALSEEIAPSSPDYFRVIEEELGLRQPMSAASTTTKAGEEVTQTQPRQPAAKPKTPIPAAPPSREPPLNDGTPTGSSERVTLNAAQQEIAMISFPQRDKEDEGAWKKRAFGTYATELVKAKAEGKIGRLTH